MSDGDPTKTAAAPAVLLPLQRLAQTGLHREEIGRSTEGRPIVAWRVGPPAAATLAVVGGVHGDETSTVEAVVELGEAACAGAVGAASFWLIPALNPDGLLRNQKNSARDVDLNRNFPASNFTTAFKAGYDPGPAPLSEPETQALARLLAREPVEAVVAVHAPFACVNFDGPALPWAEAVAAACGWPARADIGYPTPGSLGSWLGRDRGWPVLTLELPPGPLSSFRATCRAALAASVAVQGSAMNPSRMR
jgi:protein MpaA